MIVLLKPYLRPASVLGCHANTHNSISTVWDGEKKSFFYENILIGWLSTERSSRHGAADLPLGELLREETAYWSGATRNLLPGWWNGGAYPEVNDPRYHYTRAYSILRAIHALGMKTALPDVRQFAAVSNSCPPLDVREKTNQISTECDLLLTEGAP